LPSATTARSSRRGSKTWYVPRIAAVPRIARKHILIASRSVVLPPAQLRLNRSPPSCSHRSGRRARTFLPRPARNPRTPPRLQKIACSRTSTPASSRQVHRHSP
jgi:hypothetical protein